MTDADAPAVVTAIRDRGLSMWCYPDGDMFVPRGLSVAERAYIRQHRPAVLAALEAMGGGFFQEMQRGEV